MSAYITQKGHGSIKLQHEPISFSVKHTFPLSALSFSWLHVSADSLLSKKGLRYLLYPFISLWMVGGKISPSFTSALSMELSNNLRTKKREGKKEVEKNKNKSYFLLHIYPEDSSSWPLHCSHNLQGADWVLQQILQAMRSGRIDSRLKLQHGIRIRITEQKMFFFIIWLPWIDWFQNILNHPSLRLFIHLRLSNFCLLSWGFFFLLLFLNRILKGTLKCGKMIILLAIAAGEKNTHCFFPSGICVCV